MSAIGDCLKLKQLNGEERKGVVVVGYEHTPPRISLAPLLDVFESVAREIVAVHLGPRCNGGHPDYVIQCINS